MSNDEELTPRERAARQIFTQADWDREEAAGRLTAQHVAERLQRMLEHEFADPDEPAVAAYDEDGFFTSLTAASVAVVDGVKLWICTEDHPPPHVHIKRPGVRDRIDDIKINLATGEERLPLPDGVRSKQLKNFKQLVAEYHEVLCDTWTSYHGTKVETAEFHKDVNGGQS
ncbi:hypothetical protein BH09ACT12_BH09ACT12_30860 [soil metagenome]